MQSFSETKHARCLAVDSDGCVFDSMTEKHRRCFIPRLVEVWHLEEVAPLVEWIELEINLRSEHRGKNRFIALALFFESLAGKLGTTKQGIPLPDIGPLNHWLSTTPAHSESSLAHALESNPAPILREALAWSQKVNRDVSRLPPAQPFPEAVKVLRRARQEMDVLVVSSANQEALDREWTAAGLKDLVGAPGGQERGAKADQLREAVKVYGAPNVLMVGDAPADREAARLAGVAFHLIRAGAENDSWKQLGESVLPPFSSGESQPQI